MDQAATGKAFVFVTLTYGSWTTNRTDSLYQTFNGLVGNIDWGESLIVVACEFPGPNTLIMAADQKLLDLARSRLQMIAKTQENLGEMLKI